MDQEADEKYIPSRNRGMVVTKNGSTRLYVDLYYEGVRIVKTTGLKDTPENREEVEEWLDNVIRKIDNGSFKFAEAFPGASEKEKSFFAQREGWTYSAEPNEVLFGDYAEKWRKDFLSKASTNKKRDFNQVLDDWIIPKFGHLNFFQINGVLVKKFIVNDLVHRKGQKKGEALSVSRIRNILIPFRQIFDDACAEHSWSLFNPFEYIRTKKVIPSRKDTPPDVFLLDQFEKVIEEIDPYYRDHTKMLVLTGMSGSELAGLREKDIRGDKIKIQNSYVRGEEKEELKTDYRRRSFPITNAIRKILDRRLEGGNGKYLFTMKSGRNFDVDSYRKNPWTTALKRAGVPYQKPYTLRHTFAAWVLTIDIDRNRLVSLMGHGSKEMVYEVYGNYVEGLEKDRDKILKFFGYDFVG